MDWQEADGDALTLLSNTLRQGEIIAAEIALCKSLMRLKLCSFPSLADRSARAEKTPGASRDWGTLYHRAKKAIKTYSEYPPSELIRA